MEHFYKNIQGYFNFEFLYSDVVKIFPNDAKFLEIGAWQGKSSSYMAVEIINSKKNISFYCVDTWDGGSEMAHYNIVKSGKLYETFTSNISSVKDYIIPIKLPSVSAANTFPDNYFDFIFIDGDHTYESVVNDLHAWYPKLKKNGIFAGHDYGVKIGVAKAVNEFISQKQLNLRVCKSTWICDKTSLITTNINN